MRVTINLATRTYIDQRLIRRGVICCMAVMLVLTVWNVTRFSSNLGELSRLRSEIAAYEEKLNSRPAGVSENDFNRQLSSIRFYNSVIERKTYNWLGLLEQLENATPEGIALVSLGPEPKTGTLKIEGRAKGFAQVRAYVERLEDSKNFRDILLLSHSDVIVGEKTRGVQFTISCRKVDR
jgi:type IV pilus assembly protein PilN